MDYTLTQILSALIEAHHTIDGLRARVSELEKNGQQQIADLQARQLVFEQETLPPGWRLVKDA